MYNVAILLISFFLNLEIFEIRRFSNVEILKFTKIGVWPQNTLIHFVYFVAKLEFEILKISKIGIMNILNMAWLYTPLYFVANIS